jgi:hypothetical protein
VYWSWSYGERYCSPSLGSGGIGSAAKSGGALSTLTLAKGGALAVVSHTVYWSTGSTIQRVSIDGSGWTVLRQQTGASRLLVEIPASTGSTAAMS